MTVLKKWLFILLSAVCVCPVYAQQYPLQHYGIRDGLPHVTVYRIFQDSRGFIWLSTNYGVSRFDGRNFKNYSSKDGLSSNVIMSVSENENGDKFVSTNKSGIDIISNSGIRKFGVANNGVPKTTIYTCPVKNRLWIISSLSGNRLFLADRNTAKQIFIKNKKGQDANIYRIYKAGEDILFATSDGLYKVQNDTNIVPFMLRGETVADVKSDRQGGYWMALKTKVVHMAGNTTTETYELNPGSQIGDMLVDKYNNLWVAANPAELFLIRNREIINMRDRLDLPRVFVTNLCEDNEGNIWIATHGNGLYRLNSMEVIEYNNAHDNINSYCTAISPGTNGELFLGSFGKLSRWKDGKLDIIKSSLTWAEYVYFIHPSGSRLYIGTSKRIIDKETTPPFTEKNINKEQFGAISMARYHDTELLLGSYDNLYHLKNGEIVPFDTAGFFHGKRSNYLLCDEHTLWVLTDSGTIRYENGRGTYQTAPGNNQIFTCGYILKDKYNRIWFSTRDGLVCKDGNTFKTYTTKDGLADNMCKYLHEDDSGKLWVSTGNNRINIIDLLTLDISEFVADVEFTEILSIYRKENKLFIGTIEGLSVIDLSQEKSKNAVLPTYILAVATPDSQYISPPSLQLKYRENKLRIEFIGINYRHPENVEYRYLLRGIDNDWQITKNNSVELSSLPGGSYTFVLCSRLKNGTWGPEVTLPITIATPIWQKEWFIAVMVIVAITLVYLTARKRVMISQTKKNEQLLILNKITYLKQQALGALMNPHFIFNCMNSIQHYLNKNDKELANNYLSDFATLIRMTLEDAQRAFITLEKEMFRLNLYLSLEQLRFGRKLTYTITVDDKIDVHSVRLPNMIIQPYIENAILHGIMPKKGPGMITVSFNSLNANEIQVVIEDNGVGLHHKHRNETTPHHNSLGMKLTQERLNLLEKFLGQHYEVRVAEIYADDNTVAGTRVEITLPAGPDEKNISLLEDEHRKQG